ncbi:hypothetical protein [Komagataeibacter nataicola]|uniref:hypothetical protein n=1 Tax=Komagataeibacter nataicola TaxID=265960 RepID=UPI0014727BE8|nr:hypothetical protein [Komagataeibacter nataicola]
MNGASVKYINVIAHNKNEMGMMRLAVCHSRAIFLGLIVLRFVLIRDYGAPTS